MRVSAALRDILLVLGFAVAVAWSPVSADGAEADALVTEIQEGLKELGYDIRTVDGLYGPNTRSAIESFQADHDLEETGEPTDGLLRAIDKALFQRSDEAEAMWARARTYLRALGYVPGEGDYQSDAARAALAGFVAAEDLDLAPHFSGRMHDAIVERTRTDAAAQRFLCRDAIRARAYEDAYDWCRRAALSGDDVEARYLVGWMYYYGRGVEQSLVRAFRWYLAAARDGESRAQTYVGLMYRHGQGVDPDPDAAQLWYRRAVEE